MSSQYERSKYEAELDIRYGVRFNAMNEKFYRRLDAIFGFIGLFGGSGALFALLAAHPAISAWCAGVLGAASVVERMVSAVDKARDHEEFKRRFTELNIDALDLPLDQIEGRLRRLQGDAPDGIRALEILAHNANLLSNGRDDAMIKVPLLGRFLLLIV